MPEDRNSGRLVWHNYRTISAGGEAGRRIAELEAKADDQGLPNEEFAELMQLLRQHGGGEFYEAPVLQRLGVTDLNTFLANLRDLYGRAESAFRSGYYLEAISLNMLLLDLILRGFVVQESEEPIEPYSREDSRSFGQLIKAAKKVGLNEELVERLWTFNRKRTTGIHHLLLGRAKYEDLLDAYEASEHLVDDLLSGIGMPVVRDQE